ncbi:hypothetical protein TNCV_354741 [Trichonephila clavipes]|uniref:Uncharacterized protein n=1 Tax=Trichonephila clavipes TaxID=2585209 RepID=A0A8X6W120_TRICX|nr:hypothetical protein TNCV_354741 [Trichonephila clavipes]
MVWTLCPQKVVSFCARRLLQSTWPYVREILYEITKQETPQPEARKDLPPVKETGLTKVTISFQKMEETLYTYKAKYEVRLMKWDPTPGSRTGTGSWIKWYWDA